MSKRSKDAAMKACPIDIQATLLFGTYDVNSSDREAFCKGYEQAEKDTIERAVDWLNGRSNDYIFRDVYMGKEELKISSQMFDDLRKAMED